MRILITCRELSGRSGSQLYTRDLALALKQAGHTPIVYSPYLGDVADEIRRGGVPAIDDLEQLGAAPDLIHGQHHLQAMAAMLRFPDVPAIFVCHGWLPWQEAPPRFPGIRTYVAVDELRRDRLVLEHAIPPERVEVVENFVDLERFVPRTNPLPDSPRRALLFSNQAGSNTLSEVVREACSARGLELETIGLLSGRPVRQPERLLPEFDLVFARGRSALEAMAVGAAVVLCDIEGDGPLVTTANFARLRALNFGVGALQRPLDARRLSDEIEKYQAMEAERVRDLVRSTCGLSASLARMLAIYERAARSPSTPLPSTEAHRATVAASRYLEWLGPYIEEQVGALVAEADREPREAMARSEQRVAHLESVVRQLMEDRYPRSEAEISRRLADAEGRVAELTAAVRMKEAHLAEVQEALRLSVDELVALQASPFSRVRAALLRFDPLVRAYKRLTGRGGTSTGSRIR